MRIIIVLLTSMLANMAFAFTPLSKNTVASTNKIQGKIYLLSDSYAVPISGGPDLKSSKLFSMAMRLKGDGELWRAEVDFEGGHYSEVNSSYFAAREIFYEYKIQENVTSIVLGRKFEDWSSLEHNWSLSLWEPQFVLDALRPIPQGLSGLSFRIHQEYFSFTAFVSSIYMPNMGPEVKATADGRLQVNNRWVKQPNQEFPFNGKSTQILYSLDLPSVSKIVNQKSIALVSRVGGLQAGPWASVAIARKPINDLILSYRGMLQLRENGSFGDVKIVPHVINHEIASLDFGYHWLNSALVFSHLTEKPFNISPELGWNYQQFEAIEASAVQWDLNLYSYLNERAKFSVSRLYLNGGRIYEVDGEMGESHVMDGMRVKYTNAWAFDFQTPILGGSRPVLSAKIHLIRDIVEQGSLLNLEFYIRPLDEFSLLIGADVIGVKDYSNNNKSKGFLNQNRANDRIYAGIAYVF